MADATTPTNLSVKEVSALLQAAGFGGGEDHKVKAAHAWAKVTQEAAKRGVAIDSADAELVYDDIKAACDNDVVADNVAIIKKTLGALQEKTPAKPVVIAKAPEPAPVVAVADDREARIAATRDAQEAMVGIGFDLGKKRGEGSQTDGVDGKKGGLTKCGAEAVLKQLEKAGQVSNETVAAARADLASNADTLSVETARLISDGVSGLSAQATKDAREECNKSCGVAPSKPRTVSQSSSRGSSHGCTKNSGNGWYEREYGYDNKQACIDHKAKLKGEQHASRTGESHAFASSTSTYHSRPRSCRELVMQSNEGAMIGGVGQMVGAPGMFFPPLYVAGGIIGGIGTITTAEANREAARLDCYYLPAQASVGVNFGINIGGGHKHRHHGGHDPKPNPTPDGRPGFGGPKCSSGSCGGPTTPPGNPGLMNPKGGIGLN